MYYLLEHGLILNLQIKVGQTQSARTSTTLRDITVYYNCYRWLGIKAQLNGVGYKMQTWKTMEQLQEMNFGHNKQLRPLNPWFSQKKQSFIVQN